MRLTNILVNLWHNKRRGSSRGWLRQRSLNLDQMVCISMAEFLQMHRNNCLRASLIGADSGRPFLIKSS
jgi:hypothetical protein